MSRTLTPKVFSGRIVRYHLTALFEGLFPTAQQRILSTVIRKQLHLSHDTIPSKRAVPLALACFLARLYYGGRVRGQLVAFGGSPGDNRL